MLTGIIVGVVVIGAISTAAEDSSSNPPELQTPIETAEVDKPKPEPKSDPKPEPQLTVSQENAIASAQDYLSFQSFSRSGLIRQLESSYGEGFTHDQAVYAANQVSL